MPISLISSYSSISFKVLNLINILFVDHRQQHRQRRRLSCISINFINNSISQKLFETPQRKTKSFARFATATAAAAPTATSSCAFLYFDFAFADASALRLRAWARERAREMESSKRWNAKEHWELFAQRPKKERKKPNQNDKQNKTKWDASRKK